MATQVPKANVIPTEIRENFTARLCLRCNTKAESRVLMDVAGCENLPQYGFGYYITPRGKDLYKLPYTAESELQRITDYWEHARPRRHLFNRRAG
jgi:DNA segregation ATPase FtsK/SpoIIIE-like protein